MTTPDLHLDDETLLALLDAALDTAESVPAENHLSGCPDCRARAAAFEALFSSLAALPELPAPAIWLRR
jgi:anti-sigma factor RsiW